MDVKLSFLKRINHVISIGISLVAFPMSRITLNFLGRFEVNIDDLALTDFHSDKARALLAYLALEPQTHTRLELAALFWPDIADNHARTNLRNTLHRLRQTLDTAGREGTERLLNASRQTIQIRPDVARIDAIRFLALLDEASASDQSQGVIATQQIAMLAEAVDLYKGELLAGFDLPDAPAFEEWLLLRREMMHQRALLAGRTLAYQYEKTGDYGQAHAVAGRLVALDPYHEDSYRQIMHLLALMGQPDQAIRQFEQMRQLLRTEMRVEPSDQTLTMVKQIAGGEYLQNKAIDTLTGKDSQSSPSSPHPFTPSSSLDLSEVPDPGPVFGREREHDQVMQLIQRDRCRTVAILGLGGMGKSTLAAHCVRELAREVNGKSVERVLWRSLVNAPPLADLLPSLLQVLSEQRLTEVPTSLDEQLRLFLGYLRERRILLVLDNLESILAPERAGKYRSGYEIYEQLIHQVATIDHGSCLLLTSRERPHGYASLEGDSQRVQSIQLYGLDDDAGNELLTQRGLHGKSAGKTMLINRYSGNPLALKLVADTVDELFGSDISEFLAQESLVFDDIRAVLDGQFARLNDLEREILTWLAANREPMSLKELRSVLLYPPQQRQLIETIRSLQRRSLIEKSNLPQAGFGLQNVIIEYLTEYIIERICDELTDDKVDLLHRHAILNAQAKAYVRQSQARLVLQPVIERLVSTFGQTGMVQRFEHILDVLRQQTPATPSYAGGNVLNLLLHWHNNSVSDFDFSSLSIWQAFLQEATLQNVNFSDSDLKGSVFTDTFDVIYAVSFSPNGELIAAGTSNGDLRLLRPDDGQTERILKGHSDAIWGVSFSSDGQILASGSADGTVRLWEMETGGCLQILQGKGAGIHCVAFSPDGKRVASSSSDNMVHLWDIHTSEITCTLTGHTNWVQAVAFSPDGTVLASGSRDMTVRLWDVADAATGTEPRCKVLNGHSNWVYCLAFSPDGKTVASGSEDQTVLLWHGTDLVRSDEEPACQALEGHGGGVHTVAFHPDGTMLASGGGDRTVRMWDVKLGQTRHTLRAHTKFVRSVAFSPDGETLASGSWDQTVRLWDCDTGQLRRTFKGYTNWMISVDVSPDGQTLAAGSVDNHVRLWDINSGEVKQTLPGHTSWVWVVAFSPDGSLLASSSYDETIRLWSADTGQTRHILRGHDAAAESVAFSADGQILAYGSLDRQVRLADVHTGEIRHTLDGHGNWVLSVDFSPDGSLLASASSDRTVRLWDVASTRVVHTLKGHGDGVQVVAFSPDGKWLASGSWDRTIRLWDVTEWQTRHVLSGHANWIRSVAFSSDGKTLASASHDHTLRLWDVETGALLNMLEGHSNWVFAVTFTPDGKTVVSGSADGTIRLWDVTSGRCLQIWQPPGPYEGLNITNVTGITDAQKAALKALGAVET